jgi:serine protease Do
LKKLFFFFLAFTGNTVFASIAAHGFADVLEPCIPCVVSILLEKKGPFEDCPKVEGIPDGLFQEEAASGSSSLPLFPLSEKSQRCLSAVRFGSGFLIDGQGYILTNWHVVSMALKGSYVIRILFHDGTERNAKLVGYDPQVDLALLKVKTSVSLPHLNWELSLMPRVGDWVFAGGNPFGLGGSFTSGMVSCAKRKKDQKSSDLFWIQTDVPINNGNSGGPLLNTRGRVIGINTEIFSPNGAHVGISFAIPAATAVRAIQKMKGQKLQKNIATFAEVMNVEGYLCAALENISEKIKKKWGLDSCDQGVVILEAAEDQEPLLKTGDVILQVSLDFVRTPQDFKQKIYAMRHQPLMQKAKSLLLLIWRKGKGKFHVTFPIINTKGAPDESND